MSLRGKVQNGLDESRILVLGVQVLLGFHFRAVFEPIFAGLARGLQYLTLAGLGLIVMTLGFLLQPLLFHQLIEEGGDTVRLHDFINRAMRPALPIFMIVLCLDVFIATSVGVSRHWALLPTAVVAVLGFGSLMLLDWKGHRLVKRGEVRPMQEAKKPPTLLKHKIRQVLTEARVVLPGAQALLGFQFASVLISGFDKVPSVAKVVHLASLFCVTVSTMFLLAPAAYHRIVYQGEETEQVYRFASKMVLAGIVWLGLGISGDIYVVTRQVMRSDALGIAAGVACFVMLFGMWFGITYWEARHRERDRVGIGVMRRA